jgi:hypothetical protein
MKYASVNARLHRAACRSQRGRELARRLSRRQLAGLRSDLRDRSSVGSFVHAKPFGLTSRHGTSVKRTDSYCMAFEVSDSCYGDR